jgi:hypothetical protein
MAAIQAIVRVLCLAFWANHNDAAIKAGAQPVLYPTIRIENRFC